MSTVLFFVGLLALCALAIVVSQWWNGRRGADRLDEAVVVGDLLVIADSTSAVDGGYRVGVHVWRRLSARRIEDGREVARVVEDTEKDRAHGGSWSRDDALRLLGASGDVLWCSNAAMPVHRRRPATLEVIDDGHELPPLKPLSGGSDPELDPATGRVHAYTLDGRGITIAPDLSITEAARPRGGPAPSRVRLVDELTLERGRVWLTGREQRKLHGVAEPAKFHEGRIVTTGDHRGPPILILHRTPLADGGAEQLTALDERPLWTTTFAKPTLARATHLFVTGGRLVFVVEDPCEALALDAASGAVLWRVTV